MRFFYLCIIVPLLIWAAKLILVSDQMLSSYKSYAKLLKQRQKQPPKISSNTCHISLSNPI